MARVKASPCVYFLLPFNRLSLSPPPWNFPSPPLNAKIATRFIFALSFTKHRDMDGTRRCDSSSLPVLADLNGSRLSESEMISNSFLTVENSGVRLHPIENFAKTAWTNEKHNLYLDHLESSFVKQLQRSVLNTHHRFAGKPCFAPDSSNAMNLSTRGTTIHYYEEFTDQNFPDEASEQMCVNTMPKR